MAGDARARACNTTSAEPCVALPAAQDDAMNECAPRLSGPPNGHGYAGKIEEVAGDLAHDFNNLLSIITTYTRLVLEDLKADDPARPDLEEVCRAAERARELTRELWSLGQRSSGVALSM